jgi:hypothetical protein
VAHLLGEGGGRHQECCGQGNWKQLAEHREALSNGRATAAETRAVVAPQTV